MRTRADAIALATFLVRLLAGAPAGATPDAAAGSGSPAPAAGQPSAARFEATSCVVCHADLGGELTAPVEALRKGDVHAAVGLTCADCHGGDATLAPGAEPDMDRAKSPRAGYAGKPPPARIPDVCGKCHSNAAYMHAFDPNLPTDQVARYKTSVHGKRLASGDVRVATCVSCHGAHGILSVEDPRAPVFATHVPETCGRCHSNPALMGTYDRHDDPLAEYRTSVHGRALYEKSDLSAPVCNDCHGNHGAAPPEVSSVALVCGHCHVTSRQFFTASPHKAAFDRMGIPECTACHGNHAITNVRDTMVGTNSEAFCTHCHAGDGDPGLATAGQIRAALDSLSAHIERATALIDRADHAGMEVSAGHIQLQDAHTALVQARDRVHTLDPQAVREVADAGQKAALEVHTVARAALHERGIRRRGLGASLVFIALACVALIVLIRRLDARAGL